MAYDIHGNPIPLDDDEAERAQVYATPLRGDWYYVPPGGGTGDAVSLDQCDSCGNAGSWTVVSDNRGAPGAVLCDPNVVDDISGETGCGASHRVVIRRVGNERSGVVMP